MKTWKEFYSLKEGWFDKGQPDRKYDNSAPDPLTTSLSLLNKLEMYKDRLNNSYKPQIRTIKSHLANQDKKSALEVLYQLARDIGNNSPGDKEASNIVLHIIKNLEPTMDSLPNTDTKGF